MTAESSMLYAMKVGWLERDTTTRWVVGIEDMTKSYPERSMAMIPCEIIEEKNTFLIECVKYGMDITFLYTKVGHKMEQYQGQKETK